MKFPLVRDLAVEGFPVTVTCGVLGFSTQAFYKWAANPVSDRDWDDAHTINAIIDVHADDPEFGYRFIADDPRLAPQDDEELGADLTFRHDRFAGCCVAQRGEACHVHQLVG